MSTLTLAVPSPCRKSTNRRPHTWQPGDSADLISLGTPDHGVTVYLGRCRYCVVPLLAVARMSSDDLYGSPVLELHGAQL